MFNDSFALCSFSLCYDGDDYVLMSLHTWVNVVEGKMIGIDRSVVGHELVNCFAVECLFS